MKAHLGLFGLCALLTAACGTDSTRSLTREVGACGERETHVVGVYDPPAESSGTIILRVERPGRHTLVVSSALAADWAIEAAGGAIVEKVVAIGRGDQRVTAPRGAEILYDMKSNGGGGACGYAWPATPDCNTVGLLRLSSYLTDRHATSFHGCRTASRFTIGEDMAVTSDCAEQGAVQSDAIGKCRPDPQPDPNVPESQQDDDCDDLGDLIY